jgi:hypothetical protein
VGHRVLTGSIGGMSGCRDISFLQEIGMKNRTRDLAITEWQLLSMLYASQSRIGKLEISVI